MPRKFETDSAIRDDFVDDLARLILEYVGYDDGLEARNFVRKAMDDAQTQWSGESAQLAEAK